MTRLTADRITEAALKGKPRHRLLPNISFAVNYYLGRYNVPGYHLVNILIHLIVGILLFFFIKTTLKILPGRTGISKNSILIPFFAALLWLVHPVNTEAVTYVCQRMTSMAAMFYILAMLLYVKGRLSIRSRKKSKPAMFFVGCTISGLCAVASKENAATLPLFILLYEWFFFQDLKNIWTKKRIAWGLIAMVLFSIIALAYLGENPVNRIMAGYTRRDFTLPQRVMTEFRVVIYYISLFLFPFPGRLTLEHDYPLSHSLIDPWTTILSLAAIICLLGLAIKMAKKDRLVSFCILWFFGNLVIESSVIGIEIIFEHRNYLPYMMFCLLFVLMVFRLVKNRPVAIGLLCAITATASVWTFERNTCWQNELTFYQDCVNKAPGKLRPLNNLATTLAMQGRLKAAIPLFLKILETDPEYIKAYNSLGNILVRQNKIEKALNYYIKALMIPPDKVSYNITDLASVHFNLASVLLSRQMADEAVYHYKEGLKLDPNNAEAHFLIGKALMEQKKFAEAARQFKKALRLNPGLEDAEKNMKHLEKIKDKFSGRKRKPPLKTIIYPVNAALHFRLGTLYQNQKKYDMAINEYKKALLINSKDTLALHNLKACFAIKKKS